MKTDKEISALAKTAYLSKTNRSDFLQTLLSCERNFAALQYDRMSELENVKPPCDEDIENETNRISKLLAFIRACDENVIPYEKSKFVGRLLSGRVLSAGESNLAFEIMLYAEPTESELKQAKEEAFYNLTLDERHLKARLGY